MADRDAEFTLSARDRTGPAVKSAADGLEKVADKADKAQRKIDEVGDQAGQTSRKLLEARAAAAALAREFDKTGDSKVLREFQKINLEAGKLNRVFKTLTPDVQNPSGILGGFVKLGRKAGLIAGDAAVEGFGDAFKALGTASPAGSYVIAGLVGAAAAAAPFIAAAVEGAVVAGVGAGGLAAGLILGARDPRVIRAYGDLGNRILGQLQEDARPFTADLLATAPKLSKAFDAEEPRIKRIFDSLATDFGPIVDDVIGAVHTLMPSIERAAIVGGQILRSLAGQLPGLAGAVGRLLDAFTASGPGAAAALGLIVFQLRGLIELVALGARGSAPLLNLLGRLVELTGVIPGVTGNTKHLYEVQQQAGQSAGLAAQQYNNLRTSMQNTADAAQALNDSIDRLFNEQMNLDQANLAVNQGLINLRQSIKDNGTSLDETSQKGLNNVGVIQQQVRNYEAAREAAIAAGNGTLEATNTANAAYVSQLEGLRKLLYSLGLNKAQVDALIDSYEQLAKPQVKTFTTVFKEVGKVPPGYSDQSTGHSRTGANDYGGLDGWAPARFNGAARAQFAQGGGGVFQPAVQVEGNYSFTVELDGKPFTARIVRTVDAAGKRAEWRAKVGKR